MRDYQKNLIGAGTFSLLLFWSLWFWLTHMPLEIKTPFVDQPEIANETLPPTSCPAQLLYKDSPFVSCDNLLIKCEKLNDKQADCKLSPSAY